MTLLNDLKNSEPSCLQVFKTSEPEQHLQNRFHLTSEFTSRKILCDCGNHKLSVEAYKTSETKGFFRKTKVDSFWAPAFISCSTCHKKTLIFDPRKHGWDGERGDSCSVAEEGDLVQVNASPDSVYVSYSYQNLENYEDLQADGVSNPEDYFDTFALYIGTEDQALFEYECA